jgi:hypothetical protein
MTVADADIPTTDWRDLSRRAAFESHRLIGWIFWDPGAIANYASLGVPNRLGYYIATRGASLAAAGNDVVTAAFYSIHPAAVDFCLDECRDATSFELAAEARDAAVTVGLRKYVPEICDELATFAEPLWRAVDAMPVAGRPLFASLRARRLAQDPLLSAWLGVNCIREWRGDTHWALHVAADIGPVEAGVLDGAWRGYEADWLPRSRGADQVALDAAYSCLETLGYASSGVVNDRGLAFRQDLEDRLDDLSAVAWRLLGEARTRQFIELLAPVGDRLVERVDLTAGPSWMPAARSRARR